MEAFFMNRIKTIYSILVLTFLVSLCNSCFFSSILPPDFGSPVDVENADIIFDLDTRKGRIKIYASTFDGRPAVLVGARTNDYSKMKKIPAFSKRGSEESFYVNQKRIGIIGNIKEIYIEGDSAFYIDIPNDKTRFLSITIKNPENIRSLLCKDTNFDELPDFSKFSNLERLGLQGRSYDLDLSTNTKLKELHLDLVEELALPSGLNFEKFSAAYKSGEDIIDLSKHSNLTELNLNTDKAVDLFNNKKLKVLSLKNIANEELDLSNNSKIEFLELNSCSKLKAIKNFTGLTSLKEMSLKSSLVSELDFSKAPKLAKFTFYSNKLLKKIKLNANSKLRELDCGDNKIEELEIANCKNLQKIECSEVELKKMSVSNCPALEKLNCWANEIESLDLANCSNLKLLRCHNNELEMLNLKNCTSLEKIDCSNNKLTVLDCSGCKNLTQLICSENKIKQLKCANLKAMEKVDCNKNELENLLSLSGCLSLIELDCSRNNVTELNLSNCKKMHTLNCSYNKLTNLNLNEQHYLYFVNLCKNKIETNNIDKILRNLKKGALEVLDESTNQWIPSSRFYYKAKGSAYPDDNEEPSNEAKKIAVDKGWILEVFEE